MTFILSTKITLVKFPSFKNLLPIKRNSNYNLYQVIYFLWTFSPDYDLCFYLNNVIVNFIWYTNKIFIYKVILKLIDIEYSAQYSVEHVIIFIKFIKIKNRILLPVSR